MTQSARRLTIFSLLMLIFALLFSALVEHAGRGGRRAHFGAEAEKIAVRQKQAGLPVIVFNL